MRWSPTSVSCSVVARHHTSNPAPAMLPAAFGPRAAMSVPRSASRRSSARPSDSAVANHDRMPTAVLATR